MKPYEAMILDGGSECGECSINAASDQDAITEARRWASGGEWDHEGVVTLVVRRDNHTVFRREICVG